MAICARRWIVKRDEVVFRLEYLAWQRILMGVREWDGTRSECSALHDSNDDPLLTAPFPTITYRFPYAKSPKSQFRWKRAFAEVVWPQRGQG